MTLVWSNTTRRAAGLCRHRPTGNINSPAVGISKASGGCNHHVTLESSFMSSPTSFCDWAAQFWKSWYPHPSAPPATAQILLQLSETTVLAIKLEEVIPSPRKHSHSLSIGNVALCIIPCLSGQTDSPTTLATLGLSPPGTLGTNTWGKTALVNPRAKAKCCLPRTTQGSGTELRTTVLFWCAFPPSARASTGGQVSTHNMLPAGQHILPDFTGHPKASQTLFKHSMMSDSMVCHGVTGSQRQHRGERREQHWQIYPTVPNCS